MSEYNDEEAEGEAHCAAQDAYDDQLEVRMGAFPLDKVGELNNALYMLNERGFFRDDIELSADNALKAWALVERVRRDGFPDELQM